MQRPDDWTAVALRDITEKTELWRPNSQPRDIINYVDVSAVSRETLGITKIDTYAASKAPSRARKLVSSGDTILATIRPRLRRVALIPKSLDGELASTAFCILRPKPERIDGRFLFYSALTQRITDSLASLETGASYPAVRDKDVLDQQILLPPIAEQRKISCVLDTVWKGVAHNREILAHSRSLKAAALQSLFGSDVSGENAVETEVGAIPKSWSQKSLGQLADIVYGAQAAVASSTDPSIGVPILTNVNITLDGNIDLSKMRYFNVPNGQRDRLILAKGDVLFNWRSGSSNHVGKTAYFGLDGEFTHSSFILRFRAHREVSGEYLFRYLNYLHANGYFSSRRNVSSINSVYNASLAATIPVYYPALQQQQQIVDILRALDKKIDLQVEKVAVLEAIFSHLLEGLTVGVISTASLRLDTLDPLPAVIK